MATCKMCNRSGFFLSVNTYNLCTTCNAGMTIEAQSRLRVINDSMKLVDTGKTLETRMSRCDLVIEHAQALMKFEKLGIPVIKPLPSVIVKTYSENKIKILKDALIEESRQALEKVKLAATLNAKVSALSKVILKVADYRKIYPNDNDLRIIENGLRKTVQEIQLTTYLDIAKKSEFKGNKKKALDNYYEALYFLQHDDIDDTLQSDAINTIEAKIKELS